MYQLIFFCILLLSPVLAVSQDRDGGLSRGSVPEVVIRPGRGESPRYPEDTVIGELGRGSASEASFFYANSIGTGFLSGRLDHPALTSIDRLILESYFSALRAISPLSFRIGGGREEADGAVSFLIRFIGRDQGITGELYIRYVTRQIEGEDGAPRSAGSWVFEDLLLDEAARVETANQENNNRNDFYPYERLY